MKEKITILVCAHKPDAHIRNYPPYKAIQVGAALHPEIDLGFLKDNVGENISEKNPMYCEWSALYWGWKNLKNVEYKGLAHYRRYFDIDISNDNIIAILNGYDILVTNKRICDKSVFELFASGVSYDNAYLFLDILLSSYPDCKKSAISYLFNNNKYTLCSMFVAKSELYDDFCTFAFSILFKFESKMKNSGYSRLNRTLGYIGELLLGLYIEYKGLKEKIVPMLAIETCSFNSSMIVDIKNTAKFRLLNFKKTKDIPIPWESILVGFRNDNIKLDYYK